MSVLRHLKYSLNELVWDLTSAESEILKNRFCNRRQPSSFWAIDEPCSVEDFNFTKVDPSERLFQISFRNLSDCCSLVVANTSPFMMGHSLIIPDPGKLLNQPIRKKASLPFYNELESHPVDNFVLEFHNVDELQTSFGRLWNLVERCQEMKIAHNLFAARSATGALRVVLWPRRSVYGTKTYQEFSASQGACVFNIAVTELAGMFVVPDARTAHFLSLPSGFRNAYIGERLNRYDMAQLEASLASSGI
ncbi:unnamed protein product [Hydatigera taeniaeformis]|uniref:GDP-D-glucose phosphorylase 1 n=1 Tax=Hydatigena taeniaeformis TaxID=6205 RepID=A0A0R3X0U1_HYDTA|nr:unnamed protein product [Hydatigera taeniaeformis]